MTGDLRDFISRLTMVLPIRWFAEQSPNLEALLSSIATPWVWFHSLTSYVISQTRLMTATDDSLDMISNDYFGCAVARKLGESDPLYRGRISAALLREAATRPSVSAGMKNLIGNAPVIFEPTNCLDTGAYGSLQGDLGLKGMGMAYGNAGGWGSLSLPFQFFITATRPPTPGVSMVAGYGTSNGGYGKGSSSYVDLSLMPGHVSDADIQVTLCSLLPINTLAWLRII